MKKITASILVVLLLLSLAGCSSSKKDEPEKEENGSEISSLPEDEDSNSENTTDEPDANPPADNDSESDENTPSDTPSGGDTPVSSEDDKPASKPQTPDNSKPGNGTSGNGSSAQPPETPTEPDSDFSIEDIWNDIEAKLADSLPSLSALDADTTTTLYPLSTADLEEYGCYGSLMGVQASEFFIAKVKDGHMDSVKKALLSRQADMDAQWKDYSPEQYELVKNYKLVENGNYIFFGVAKNVSAAVEVFNSYTK